MRGFCITPDRSFSYVTVSCGLGNRIIPMGCALNLASELNYRPIMFWTAVPELGGARFEDLFDATDLPFELVEGREANIPKAIIYILRRDRPWSYTKQAILKMLRPLIRLRYDKVIRLPYRVVQPAVDLLDYRKILYSTGASFRYGCDLNWLKPAPQIAPYITELKQQFTADTVGLHIRGTDARMVGKIPPIEEMITRILAEIELNPNVKFFLASDGDETEERILNLFGERLIKTKLGVRRRRSLKGQENAVVDLFGLAMTSRIIGYRYSTFATLAALIGNKPLLRIKPRLKGRGRY